MLVGIPFRYCIRPGIQIDDSDRSAVVSICKQFGVKVSSGYRSPEVNALEGGAKNSDHLRGQAADFVGTPGQMSKLYNWAQGKFPYVEPWSQSLTHVHISFQYSGDTSTASIIPSTSTATSILSGCGTSIVTGIAIGLVIGLRISGIM